MDLTALQDAVARAGTVVASGSRTHEHVGDPVVADAVTVRAPAGVVRYEPADMTITVGAGTSFAELREVLADAGQECPLDPRDERATVGGVLACGLSGVRRLRHGPVRDHVLEVRVVLGDGRVVKGGGPTVKNVTGYDLPRLYVGSLGTLGVIAQLTLRCRPLPAVSRWFRAPGPPPAATRPSAVLWDGERVEVCFEGSPADVEEQARGMYECEPPRLPAGAHRGRVSIAPTAIRGLGAALGCVPGLHWCAELGVGTVHVASDDVASLLAARDAAHAHGGWLLREHGAEGVPAFGRPLPNLDLVRRVKDAFDPDHKFAPGRLPLGPAAAARGAVP